MYANNQEFSHILYDSDCTMKEVYDTCFKYIPFHPDVNIGQLEVFIQSGEFVSMTFNENRKWLGKQFFFPCLYEGLERQDDYIEVLRELLMKYPDEFMTDRLEESLVIYPHLAYTKGMLSCSRPS